MHRIALHPIWTLLIDRLPNCFIVNLASFVLFFCPLERASSLHHIQGTRNWRPAKGRLVIPPSVNQSVRAGCSSPPVSPRNGTCIVPCSSSSTVDTPNISAILQSTTVLSAVPDAVLAGSGCSTGSGSGSGLWPGSGRTVVPHWTGLAGLELNNLPCPPLAPEGIIPSGPIHTHPYPSTPPSPSQSVPINRPLSTQSAPIELFVLSALLCPLASLSLPFRSPVRPPVDLDLLPHNSRPCSLPSTTLTYPTTPLPPPVAVQSFHWISILANLLFCTSPVPPNNSPES